MSNISHSLVELELIRDILTQAKALADNHGLRALEMALNYSPQQPTSQLVWGRTASRLALMDAIAQAKERLIIVCPWLSRSSLDDELLLRLRVLLEQNCRVEIGWGYGYDIGSTISLQDGKWWINASGDAKTRYSALPHLCKLRQSYPDLLQLKLLGTHEKFWVCDRQSAFIGTHNVLSSNILSLNALCIHREVGIHSQEPEVIEGLIQGFEAALDVSCGSSKFQGSMRVSA